VPTICGFNDRERLVVYIANALDDYMSYLLG